MNGDIKKAYNYYRNWVESCGLLHTIQVSLPRSGRHWLTAIINWSMDVGGTNKAAGDIQMFNISDIEYLNYKYFCTHYYNWPGFYDDCQYVLLIRDPRDSILSYMYLRAKNEEITIKQSFEDYNFVEQIVNNFLEILNFFPSKNTLIVQYETLCLYPVQMITKVMNFANLEPVVDIEEVITRLDGIHHQVPEIALETAVGDYSIESYDSGETRYNNRCLKWRRDKKFTQRHFDLIWDAVGDIIPLYGYTKDGHNKNLLR